MGLTFRVPRFGHAILKTDAELRNPVGTFRTLKTTLPCLKCDTSHRFDIQFKTGDDTAMPEYEIDDLAGDIAPGVQARWVDDEKHAHFDALADEVGAGVVTARRAVWRHGSVDGRPELGLVVTLDDEPPLTPGQIRALADVSESAGWPNFGARLIGARVTLWVGATRITPGQPQSEAAYTAWWHAHHASVTARLRAQGWPSGDEQFREVPLEVMSDHRFRLA